MNQKSFLGIIAKSLGIKSEKISINSKFNEIEEWDSISHLTMLSLLDKATKGKSAKIKDLGTEKSVKKLWEILKKKGLAK
jgi:acyl carrier protein